MTDVSMFDLSAYHDRNNQRLDPIIARRKTALFAAMATHNIAEIQIAYDGEGDEGQLGEIDAYRNIEGCQPSTPTLDHANPIPVELENCPGPIDAGEGDRFPSISELIDDLAWNILNRHHDGFEISDGGFGTITVNAASRTVKLEKSDRFIEHTTEEVEA